VNARPPSAVAAGNVETSSRIVDVVTAAIGQAVPTMAMGQGTMNNLTIGAPGFTYYETLAGGQGAGPAGPGPSAVHVAMSNTLNTPVEALESTYPVRVERYAVRTGSGGAGRHRGGDGVVRALRLLVDAQVSIISERRITAPRGAAGGLDGSPGLNRLDDRILPGKWSGDVPAGTVIEIATPGGGGWGSPGGA
jgi:N-methylhydantoinase B